MAIHTEPNQKRRMLRVNEPIDILIKGKKYKAEDWSAGGFRLKDYDGASALGDAFQATLELPCRDGNLELAMEARILQKKDRTIHCDFIKPSEHNTRMLYAYIDALMEGAGISMSAVMQRSLHPREEKERHLIEEQPTSQLELSVRRIPIFHIAIGVIALVLIGLLGTILYHSVSETAMTYINRNHQYQLIAASRVRQAEAQLESLDAQIECASEILGRLKDYANSGSVGANQFALAKRDLRLLKVQKKRFEDLLVILRENQAAVAEGNFFYEIYVLDKYQTNPQEPVTANSSVTAR